MCLNPLTIHNAEGDEVTVKCGKCFTCRRERSQEWAIKLINESKYHTESCFITLTFSNEILMDRNSKAYKFGAHPYFARDINLSKRYFQKFIKRLRKKFPNKQITYYHVGEYGEKTHRAHHHVLLYGVNFNEDRKQAELSKSGKPQYFSQTLEDLWACGRTRIQEVNSNNIIYIAAYSLKKFKTDEENKRWKSVQSFSNRSKMNIKFIRRYPELIEKGYFEDKDGKHYRIPKSYKENLKKDENPRYNNAYINYENKILDYIEKTPEEERMRRERAKKEIFELQNKEKKREF